MEKKNSRVERKNTLIVLEDINCVKNLKNIKPLKKKEGKKMITTVYVVSSKDNITGVFTSRADTEEMCLSIAEENAYLDFLWMTCHYSWTIDDYFAQYKDAKSIATFSEIKNRWYPPRQTIRSLILDLSIEDTNIQEVNFYT